MQKIIAVIICWCWFLQATAQPNITAAEYFIDTDPGFGNATSIPITPSPNIADNTFSVALGSVPQGVHALFIRSKDANGKWSITNRFVFYKPSASAGLPPANIVKSEYFFDTDPGFGNATNIPVTAATDVQNVTFGADITALSIGVHSLFIRSRDANGKWSITNQQVLYKPNSTGTSAISNIVKAEYFFDTDPGFGNATNIPVTAGTDVQNVNFGADISALSVGVHSLFIRSRDANGKWSITNRQILYKPNSTSASPISNIVKAEYFFDTDPGFGNAADVPVTPGTDVQNVTFAANISTLSVGVHSLFIRSKDASGKWSITNQRILYKPTPASGLPPANITNVEYFIDTDPGFGNAVPVVVNPAPDIADFITPINISGLSVGNHKLYMRSKTITGWSITNVYTFPIAATATSPFINVNAITKKIICARDSVKLSFDARGTFNAGNIFNAELSDANGSFASPVVIGSYTGTSSAIISAVLPNTVAGGTNFRVRVSSTNPVVTGLSGSDALTIGNRSLPQTITGMVNVNGTFGYNYTIPAVTGSTWNWMVTQGIQTSGTNTNNVGITWNQPASVTSTGTIKLVETNYGCTGDTSTLNLTIYKLRIGNTVANNACKGFGLNVNINADGAYYSGNTYTAQLSDDFGSFASPTAIGNATLVGNGVGQTASINATIPPGIPNGTGYKVRIVSSNPAFTGDTSAAISIIKPDIGVDITRSKCLGFGYNLTQNYTDASLTYGYYTASFGTLARPDSVDAGTYQVIATNSTGCKDTAAITVTNYPKPDLGPDKTVTTACPGSTYDLTNVFTTTGLTISWNTAIPTAAPAGTYQLIVTNSNGCKDTASVTVNNTPITSVATVANTKTANRECTTTDGWTHYYYDNNTPADNSDDIRLLSLKKNGQNIGTIGDGSFQVRVAATTGAGTNTAVPVTSSLLTTTFYSMNRYWNVTPTTQPATNVGVRFYYNTQDLADVNGSYPMGPVNHTQLVLYKTDGNPDPTTNWAGATQVKTYMNGTTPSASSWVYASLGNGIHQAEFEVTSFSGGGAGATQNGALPITLLRFTATGSGYTALLNWATSSETNSRNFIIARSYDGVNYTTAGSVNAAGQSNTQQNYSFTDDLSRTLTGPTTVYYKLIMIDRNGDQKTGPVATVKLGNAKASLSLLYNPVQAEAVLQYQSLHTETVAIRLLDAAGRTILQLDKTAITGTNQYRVSTATLAKGIYNVILTGNNGQALTLSMMKE